MANKAELIAAQMASGFNIAKIWGDLLYNVKAYGAKGDGVTDDTAEIQSAVNAAVAAYGCVFFPKGKYRITSTITVSLPIAMMGIGAGSEIIIDAAVSAGFSFSQENPQPSYSKQYLIARLGFIYTGTGKVLSWDYTGHTNVWPDSIITQCYFNMTSATGTAIWMKNLRSLLIQGNTFIGNYNHTCIYNEACYNQRISDNVIWQCKYGFNLIEGEGPIVQGNDLVGATYGVYAHYIPYVHVTGNMLDWCQTAVYLNRCWESDISHNYMATDGRSSTVILTTRDGISTERKQGISVTHNKILNYQVQAPTTTNDIDVCGIYGFGNTGTEVLASFDLSHNYIKDYEKFGIFLTGCADGVISSNWINTTQVTSGKKAISTANVASKNRIIDNYVDPNGTIDAAGNTITGNTNFLTEIDGFTTIGAGLNFADVSLPLPTGGNYRVYVTPTDDMGGIWVSSSGSFGFRVNVKTAPASNKVVFYKVVVTF